MNLIKHWGVKYRKCNIEIGIEFVKSKLDRVNENILNNQVLWENVTIIRSIFHVFKMRI